MLKRFFIPILIIVLLGTTVVSAQDVVIFGQPDAGSVAPNRSGVVSADGLNFPLGIAVDSTGGFYVADRNNHRVLYFANDGNTTADRVYGQSDNFNTYIINYDGVAGSGMPSEKTLNMPTVVGLDAQGGLYVADRDNHRILYFAAGDTTADRVYGQLGNFTINPVNNDGIGIGGSGTPSADNIGVYTLGVAADASGGLYISDSSNHRILYFAAGDTTADRVYGHAGSFTSGVRNDGNTPSADSLSFPRGLVVDAQGGLYVADRDNNRVLYFANDGNTTADRVYGQAGNFTTNVANMDAAQPSADSLFSPRAVALDATGGLYIADSSNNRILYFAPDGDTTADWVYGQAGAFNTSASGSSVDMLNAPQGVSVAPDGRVYIADTGNNRVLVVPR